ncbi:MAG: ABC transporter substrate-binding protein [bacterium]|nr:ABC transporter substrate-binding protein [bacterium]
MGLFFQAQAALAQSGGNTLRVAYFSNDVPSIDPLSPAFDPDSYAVVTQIFDSLVFLDLDGKIRPGLATGWRRTSDTSWEFTLRKGVQFHNGERFDGRAVKFTYDFALDPENQAGNAWILSSIASVELTPDDPFKVIIHTHFPDGMFLNRFSMFGSICPPDYFRKVGRKGFAAHPVGTGPYRFSRWHHGRFIELERNHSYWDESIPRIERVRFEILPQDQWLDAFLEGRVDFVPNLAGNQTTRLMKESRGNATILKRLVLSGYWVLIRNEGPLADLRVRKALNYSLNKEALVRFADYGNAKALASLGKQGEFGANPDLSPYPYEPETARRLLAEAAVATPLTLTAIVADIALPVAKIMRHDFAHVGINLKLQVAPRAEWAQQVVGHKILHGHPPDYDLAINLVDNPIHNLAFHAGLFLHSPSPWALLVDPEFDARYEEALQTVQSDLHQARLEELDRYIHENALMVFTTQRVITAAVRKGVVIPQFSLNGHVDYLVLSTARMSQ